MRLQFTSHHRLPLAISGQSRAGSRLLAALVVLSALLSVACGQPAIRLPLKPFYAPADRTAGSVHLDVAYRDDQGADSSKHRLDLYLPPGNDWPMLVFVHGGSLEKGDTSQRAFGHDIYRNIGRFFSSQGVAVALVNYRLQPEVTWLEQVEDVATAVSWLGRKLENVGRSGPLYLSGHSAGSWLVARVALDAELRDRHELDAVRIDGVISVSGSGFDLTDQKTWDMFGREERWRRRFSAKDVDPRWKTRASVLPLIEEGAPPFLLLHSRREHRALARQNRLFCDALEAAKVPCELEEFRGHGHRRMLLALSHAKRPVAHRILDEVALDP